MTWRAIKNALAGLLAGLAGGVLLGALAVIGWAAILSLVEGAGDWEHVGLYIVVAVLVIAWRSEGLGGLLFVALGVWYVSECWGRFPRGTLAVIGGPPMFIGLLFLLDCAYRARFGYRD